MPPAVVLCDIDRYVEEDFKKLMYVGCSRARAYLSVLLTDEPTSASLPATTSAGCRRGLDD
jgi:hypothetical protein